jgi:serine/threonine-protein kinase
VDSAGNLYVVDANNYRVLERSAGAATQTELPFTGLNYPGAVAADAAGNHLADSGNDQVLKLPAR